jgi:hypothetical protein
MDWRAPALCRKCSGNILCKLQYKAHGWKYKASICDVKQVDLFFKELIQAYRNRKAHGRVKNWSLHVISHNVRSSIHANMEFC